MKLSTQEIEKKILESATSELERRNLHELLRALREQARQIVLLRGARDSAARESGEVFSQLLAARRANRKR